MIRRTIGALVGAEIDHKHGGSVVRGAVIGAVAAGVLRRMGPLGLVLGGAWTAKQMLDRRREARRPIR